MVASAVLLLNAGHEASVNVFGNGSSRCAARPAPRPAAHRPVRGGDAPLRPGPPAVRAHRHRRRDRRRVSSSEGRRSRCCSAPRTATRGLRRPRHLPDHPRPQPAPGLRGRAALLPRRAAGPDGARRVGRPAPGPALADGRGTLAGPSCWGHTQVRRLLTTSGTTGQKRNHGRAARRRRGDHRQARRRRARRRADRLGDRRLHPRCGRRRADGRAGDGDPAERDEPPRGGPLDRGDDRVGSGWTSRRSRGPRPTSTPPRASATRSPSRSPRSSPPAAWRSPAVGPRPRAHRRHPGQARVDPRLARGPRQRRDDAPARGRRRRHLRSRRAGRPADKKLLALRDT